MNTQKINAVKALVERGATEGERAAAREALNRLQNAAPKTKSWETMTPREKFQATMNAQGKERVNLTGAQIKKAVVKGLKERFPGVTFKVTCRQGDLTIEYVDGPATEDVKDFCGYWNAKGFDGSIDLSYYYYHWLLPNGELVLAYTSGTEGSLGWVPAYWEDKPHADAILISSPIDYVTIKHSLSEGLIDEGIEYLAIDTEEIGFRKHAPNQWQMGWHFHSNSVSADYHLSRWCVETASKRYYAAYPKAQRDRMIAD